MEDFISSGLKIEKLFLLCSDIALNKEFLYCSQEEGQRYFPMYNLQRQEEFRLSPTKAGLGCCQLPDQTWSLVSARPKQTAVPGTGASRILSAGRPSQILQNTDSKIVIFDNKLLVFVVVYPQDAEVGHVANKAGGSAICLNHLLRWSLTR